MHQSKIGSRRGLELVFLAALLQCLVSVVFTVTLDKRLHDVSLYSFLFTPFFEAFMYNIISTYAKE